MKINEVSDKSSMMSIKAFSKEHAWGSHYDVNKALVEGSCAGFSDHEFPLN